MVPQGGIGEGHSNMKEENWVILNWGGWEEINTGEEDYYLNIYIVYQCILE